MKRLTLAFVATAALSAISGAEEAPSLEGTVGIGAGIGVQRYYGTYGDQGSIYGRGFAAYHPLEWLGTRLTVGYGDLTNDEQMRPAYETDWFSNIGLDLVLQPRLGLGGFRPYLASGISTTFGSSTVDKRINYDLDWNFYAPVELGVEYLINDSWSAWAWGETYLHMEEWDKLDGVASRGDYWSRRDDVQRVGAGVTFRFGIKKDADGDGIPDALDQCQATPKGVKVDALGCPLDADKDGVPDFKDKCAATAAKVSVDTLGCPVDLDKDGVADYLDKCSLTPAGVKVDASGCPLDADKDGIADYLDKCAATKVGTKVDGKGCPLPMDADKDGVSDSLDKCPATPAGAKVDAKGCPLDSDKDGVADYLDKCAATKVGTKVDATGCAPDADKDGIADELDKCPNSRPGEKVDSTGCMVIVIEKGAKLTLDGIVFKSGSAIIDKVSAPTLTRAAAAIAKAPEAVVEIAGFTDNTGKEATNKALSQKRAAAVKAYLVKLKVPAKQLVAKGYGSAQPVADNATEAGRAQNRRIEFRVK
jgi:outer membrane protein OmpA-like peptidoglycan-associated protein